MRDAIDTEHLNGLTHPNFKQILVPNKSAFTGQHSTTLPILAMENTALSHLLSIYLLHVFQAQTERRREGRVAGFEETRAAVTGMKNAVYLKD